MKTDTVNTESNFFEENWRHLNDGEIGCFIGADENIYLTTTTNDFGILYPNADAKFPCKNAKETAQLIVTAVNACKEINPDNPIAVAKELPELISILNALDNAAILFADDHKYYYDKGNQDKVDSMLAELHNAHLKARTIIKQITE